MDVFAFYDCSPDAPADQADMVTLWERSWRNRGWKPRLITARHARRSKYYKGMHHPEGRMHSLALHAAGGGWMTPLWVLNFSLTPEGARKVASRGFFEFPCGVKFATRPALKKFLTNEDLRIYGSALCCRYHSPRWMVAPLVAFQQTEDALTCGRPL